MSDEGRGAAKAEEFAGVHGDARDGGVDGLEGLELDLRLDGFAERLRGGDRNLGVVDVRERAAETTGRAEQAETRVGVGLELLQWTFSSTDSRRIASWPWKPRAKEAKSWFAGGASRRPRRSRFSAFRASTVPCSLPISCACARSWFCGGEERGGRTKRARGAGREGELATDVPRSTRRHAARFQKQRRSQDRAGDARRGRAREAPRTCSPAGDRLLHLRRVRGLFGVTGRTRSTGCGATTRVHPLLDGSSSPGFQHHADISWGASLLRLDRRRTRRMLICASFSRCSTSSRVRRSYARLYLFITYVSLYVTLNSVYDCPPVQVSPSAQNHAPTWQKNDERGRTEREQRAGFPAKKVFKIISLPDPCSADRRTRGARTRRHIAGTRRARSRPRASARSSEAERGSPRGAREATPTERVERDPRPSRTTRIAGCGHDAAVPRDARVRAQNPAPAKRSSRSTSERPTPIIARAPATRAARRARRPDPDDRRLRARVAGGDDEREGDDDVPTPDDRRRRRPRQLRRSVRGHRTKWDAEERSRTTSPEPRRRRRRFSKPPQRARPRTSPTRTGWTMIAFGCSPGRRLQRR